MGKKHGYSKYHESEAGEKEIYHHYDIEGYIESKNDSIRKAQYQSLEKGDKHKSAELLEGRVSDDDAVCTQSHYKTIRGYYSSTYPYKQALPCHYILIAEYIPYYQRQQRCYCRYHDVKGEDYSRTEIFVDVFA